MVANRPWAYALLHSLSWLVVHTSPVTAAAAAAKSLQLCLNLCDPIDSSPPGSPIPGILQAGTLEWVAISFSSAWKWKVKVKWLSCVQLFATPWTAAHQAPPPMGFSRQDYCNGVPSPSPIQALGGHNHRRRWKYKKREAKWDGYDDSFGVGLLPYLGHVCLGKICLLELNRAVTCLLF